MDKINSIQKMSTSQKLIRSAYLLDIEVLNPTREQIHVRSFEIQIMRDSTFNCWGSRVLAISLPNRIQHKTGASIKLLKNWFSIFSDDHDLTVNGKIGPKESVNAFALFVSLNTDSQKPKIEGKYITVRACVRLATSERLYHKERIKICDLESFEGYCSGITAQIRHSSAAVVV